MSKNEQMEWIKCSDRMPNIPEGERYVNVLVHWTDGSVCEMSYRRSTVRGKEVERFHLWDTLAPSYWNITHWMPLPEPPKD